MLCKLKVCDMIWLASLTVWIWLIGDTNKIGQWEEAKRQGTSSSVFDPTPAAALCPINGSPFTFMVPWSQLTTKQVLLWF